MESVVNRKTKIVCTLGPATDSGDGITRLLEAGMNAARLNYSHGTREQHARTVGRIRAAARRLGRPVAVVQDLAGPKVRIGAFAGGAVTLEPRQRFTLTTRAVTGTREAVSVSHAGLPADVSPGDTLLLGDGAIELAVESADGTEIRCRVILGGVLGDRKGINLPSRSLSVDFFTAKDRADLLSGLEAGVDYVALSFVRSAEDMTRVREVMRAAGREVPLLAKIEKHEALANIDGILAAADGIMIARGDLGVEIPIEQVPRVQKRLLEQAYEHELPVITATQMLASMVESPRPTRAEVTDVANAVLDGTDAVMLSEETAVGRFPAAAVNIMARIALDAETLLAERPAGVMEPGDEPGMTGQAVADAAVRLSRQVGAAAILVCTRSGATARLVTRAHPLTPVLALTPDESVYHRAALLWGAVPLKLAEADTAEAVERLALRTALESGHVQPGQTVVLTAGLPLHTPGTTNTIRVVTVPTNP
jgi:pyruvate kinase